MANIQQASAQDKVEKIAKITLWTLIGLTILVVALFVGIGYDTPYEEKPTIVNPQLTDLLICWTYSRATILRARSCTMNSACLWPVKET